MGFYSSKISVKSVAKTFNCGDLTIKFACQMEVKGQQISLVLIRQFCAPFLATESTTKGCLASFAVFKVFFFSYLFGSCESVVSFLLHLFKNESSCDNIHMKICSTLRIIFMQIRRDEKLIALVDQFSRGINRPLTF